MLYAPIKPVICIPWSVSAFSFRTITVFKQLTFTEVSKVSQRVSGVQKIIFLRFQLWKSLLQAPSEKLGLATGSKSTSFSNWFDFHAIRCPPLSPHASTCKPKEMKPFPLQSQKKRRGKTVNKTWV